MEDERDFVELNLEALAFREASGDGKQKSPCPDEELFGAYMEGRLSGEEAEAVAAHMDRCPRCNFAFRLWKEVDKSPAPAVPSPLLEEAKALAKRPFKRFVLRLMERALELLNPEEASLISPDPSPATVPCRGDGSEPVYGAEVMEFDLGLPGFSCLRIQHLEAVDTTGEKARVTVITDPSLDPEDVNVLRLDLHGPEGLLQSWPLDSCATVLNPLEKGTYRLVFSRIEKHGASVHLHSLGSIALDLR